MNRWLFKSEPDAFSIDDLAAAPGRRTQWDGVRNYQVRNMIRDQMQAGDLGFFYHSSCPEPGIAGIVKVVGKPKPDESAFDPASKYHDPGSKPDAPRWYMIDVQLVRKFPRLVSLDELRALESRKLSGMLILRRGNRLSITPVEEKHWNVIESLATTS